jgi:hypothetical protein
VDGAITRCPKISPVDPALSTCMSSMLSAPASIPCTNDITLRPGNAAPGDLGSSHTDSFASASIPNRSANVAVTNKPALLTSRCSSKRTRTESRFAGPSGTSAASCTIWVTS